jgi:YggT family protein
MLNPFIDLLANILKLYMYIVIAWAVLATLISFKVVNAYQPIIQKVMYTLNKLCEPVCARIRKYLPDLGSIDIAPILLILLINFGIQALYTYFYSYGIR